MIEKTSYFHTNFHSLDRFIKKKLTECLFVYWFLSHYVGSAQHVTISNFYANFFAAWIFTTDLLPESTLLWGAVIGGKQVMIIQFYLRFRLKIPKVQAGDRISTSAWKAWCILITLGYYYCLILLRCKIFTMRILMFLTIF